MGFILGLLIGLIVGFLIGLTAAAAVKKNAIKAGFLEDEGKAYRVISWKASERIE